MDCFDYTKDGTDEAANVRPGTDSDQVIRNYHNWLDPDLGLVDDLTNFTVLSNLNMPYADKLAKKIKSSFDTHFKNNLKKFLTLTDLLNFHLIRA